MGKEAEGRITSYSTKKREKKKLKEKGKEEPKEAAPARRRGKSRNER